MHLIVSGLAGLEHLPTFNNRKRTGLGLHGLDACTKAKKVRTLELMSFNEGGYVTALPDPTSTKEI